MSTNDPSRDWFAPPSNQPSQPPPQPPQGPQPPLRPRRAQRGQPRGEGPAPFGSGPRPRRATHPDQQVWPPARREPVVGSTQPIPVIPSAGPLPPAQPAFRPGPPPPSEPAPPPAPPPAAPAPRRSRTLLLGVGALVAFALGMGLPTADRYLFYTSGQPSETVHVVAAGRPLTFEHVTWKSAIEPMKAPEGSKPLAPDKLWIKITVTRTAVDKTGAVLTGSPKLTVHDRQGRKWMVETLRDDMPTDGHQVGQAYSFTSVAIVPKAVAGEVELHLAPNITYRSDTPTDKLLEIKPEDEEKRARNDVLVFRR